MKALSTLFFVTFAASVSAKRRAAAAHACCSECARANSA
jgi:hypothetical protein